MAGIDKTYISNWEVFDKIRNWAIKQKFTLKNGQVIKLINYLYYPNLTKEEWFEHKAIWNQDHPESTFDVVLWNTPTYVDIWLIRNCPFEEIQERLKEQYGGGWSKTAFTDYNDASLYDQIKAGTSVYDTYQRNGLGWKSKVEFHNVYGCWCRDKDCRWWIDVNACWVNGKPTGKHVGETFWYNEKTNSWYCPEEALPYDSNVMHYKGTLTKKKIVRMLKNWNFPKDTVVTFSNQIHGYIMHEFYVIVK